MARTRYPKELKERVIREALETGNAAAVARRHELNVSVVYSWMRQHRLSTETDSGATSTPGGDRFTPSSSPSVWRCTSSGATRKPTRPSLVL